MAQTNRQMHVGGLFPARQSAVHERRLADQSNFIGMSVEVRGQIKRLIHKVKCPFDKLINGIGDFDHFLRGGDALQHQSIQASIRVVVP